MFIAIKFEFDFFFLNSVSISSHLLFPFANLTDRIFILVFNHEFLLLKVQLNTYYK